MILIDSNMWCFYFSEDSKEHEKASKAIEEALANQRVLSNAAVIAEVSHFLVKNLGPRIGKSKIDTLLSFPMTIIDLDFSLMKQSISMLCDYSHTGIGGRDATLLAALKHAGANKIMTNDGAFKKIDWLEVLDPLEQSKTKSAKKVIKKEEDIDDALKKDWSNK